MSKGINFEQTAYMEAVKMGKEKNDWSDLVSQEVNMIVQNGDDAKVVWERLNNLNELIFNAWYAEEPKRDIGTLILKNGGIEALVSVLSQHLANFRIQLLGYEALSMLALKATSESAAAQGRVRLRVLRIHAAGGIGVVLRSIAAHKKQGPELKDAVTFLGSTLLECFDPDTYKVFGRALILLN